MSLLTDFQATQHPEFRQKMAIACGRVAGQVIGETTAGAGVRRDKRHDLAMAFIASPNTQVDRFMLAIVAGSAIDNTSTDAQILSAVTSAWDKLAGVKNGET